MSASWRTARWAGWLHWLVAIVVLPGVDIALAYTGGFSTGGNSHLGMGPFLATFAVEWIVLLVELRFRGVLTIGRAALTLGALIGAALLIALGVEVVAIFNAPVDNS